MTQKRRKFSLNRRRFDSADPSTRGGSQDISSSPDIIAIWREQKRIREEEARLEREYEQAKTRLRELQIQMKQKDSMLSDIEGLQSTFYEDSLRNVRTFGLWFSKTYKKLKLKSAISYLKIRARLGVPVTGRATFGREKLAIAMMGLLVAGTIVLLSANSSAPKDETKVIGETGAGISQVPINQTPEFAVLTPNGQGVGNLGGFAKVSPGGKAPVYTFVDELESTRIRVSQQQLPEIFKSDPTQLEKMAKDFNANRMLSSDIGKVYIGQSLKGPQSLVFQKDGLLVLIASDQPIPDSSWQQYLSDLKI